MGRGCHPELISLYTARGRHLTAVVCSGGVLARRIYMPRASIVQTGYTEHRRESMGNSTKHVLVCETSRTPTPHTSGSLTAHPRTAASCGLAARRMWHYETRVQVDSAGVFGVMHQHLPSFMQEEISSPPGR